MFVINKLLRKYKVHHVSFCNKKSTVQKKLHKKIMKLRQKAKQRRKPKKLATRRSARIAGKIKQQNEFDWKVEKESTKSEKLNKSTKGENNSKPEPTESKRFSKIKNVNDLIQNSGNKKIMAESDKETITRDILKLIAQKRTLKRKLSICQRPNFSLNDDGYCYHEDGQISEMLSSFINNSFDEPRADSLNVKKSRSQKPSIETRAMKEGKKKKVPPIKLKKHIITDDKGKLKKSHSKEKNSKKEMATDKSQKSSLPPTEAYAINKTEKKNTSLGKTLAFPTKASVKEVIPAKRTRFLSIDSSLMRYGAESKRSYNHMKSLKQNSESPELGRGKVSAQKPLKTTTVDAAATKKMVQKSKRIKEKNGTVSEIKKPSELKQLPKAAQKVTQSQKAQNACEKVKVPLKQAIKENSEMKELLISKPVAKESPPIETIELSEKSVAKAIIIEDVILKSATDFSNAWKQSYFANKLQPMGHDQSKSQENNVEQNDLSDKANSTENDEGVLNTNPPLKLSIKKQDKPLSERSLCSTMVSPLKIIIEPKRDFLQMTHKERILAKDPLAIGQFNDSNLNIVESPPDEHVVETKEVHKASRLLERLKSLSEKPLPKDVNQVVNRSISLQSETEVKPNDNKKVEEKLQPNSESISVRNEIADVIVSQEKPVSIATTASHTLDNSTLFKITDTDATIKPYLDIEMLLPSTRIPQPKPAKRCLKRAQTISHAETPYHRTFEPMQLRSSNFAWNQRQMGPSKEPTKNQYRSSLPYKSIENPFTIPKRKPILKTVSPPRTTSSPKTNNGSTNAPVTLQRTPIDMSSYPDPESLEIPSIDLRSSALCNSPLNLPLPISIPKPVLKPVTLTTMPISKPTIVNTETVKAFSPEIGNFEVKGTISENNCMSEPRLTISDPRLVNDVERKSPIIHAHLPPNVPSIAPAISPAVAPRSPSISLPLNIPKNIPMNILSSALTSFQSNESPSNASPTVSSANITPMHTPPPANRTPIHTLSVHTPNTIILPPMNMPPPNMIPLSMPPPNMLPPSSIPKANVPMMPPEMSTIPLELDRVVTQQRKIREMRRRNSLCVAEISNYQRNILNKFANSIKQKKLKIEDIEKIIFNKPPSPSSSSASSSSSESDSSDSDSSESDSSSSTSSGSVRKSRRHHKKKRSHKRNSNSDDSSSESSSSSSSSSASSRHGAKRAKHYRKSVPKTTKTPCNRKSYGKATPKPIFDIETIKQNALMGCVLHEEIIRNKLNQMSSYPNISSRSPSYIQQSPNTSALRSVGDTTPDSDHTAKVPFVKLQRNTFIDNLAENFAQEQHINNNNNNNNNSTRYKRKRSD